MGELCWGSILKSGNCVAFPPSKQYPPAADSPPAEAQGLSWDRASEACCEHAIAGRRRRESGAQHRTTLAFGWGEEVRVFLLGEAVCKPTNLPTGNNFEQTGISSCSHLLDFSIQKFVHNRSFPMPTFPSLHSPLTPEELGKMHKQQDHTYSCHVQ